MAERVPPSHRAAGERIIAAILADPETIAVVAKKAIFEKVRSGELIEAHRLAIAPGMVLERAGHVDELNAAIDSALELLDAGDVPAAMRVLADTIPAHELAGAGADEHDEAEPEPEPEPPAPVKKAPAKKAAAKKKAKAAEPAATPRRRERVERTDGTTAVSARRPKGYPVGHADYPCQWPDGCDERVPQGAAEVSFTRIKDEDGKGVVLCVDHMTEAIAAE